MRGIKHRKALVVLGCDHYIFHPRCFGGRNDRLCVELGRVKILGDALVVGIRNFHLPFDPLADTIERLILPLSA